MSLMKDILKKIKRKIVQELDAGLKTCFLFKVFLTINIAKSYSTSALLYQMGEERKVESV